MTVITALIVLSGSLAQAQAQAPAPAPQAGIIRGHIFDRDTGKPLSHAVVRVAPMNDDADARIVVTDERGAFDVGGLPPGRYSGIVVARQHEFQPLRAGAIVLARDEVVDVVARVPPTFGVDVRVVDPSGEPLSGLEIQAVDLDTGRTPFASQPQGTDDLGHMRVFGLVPGRYVICAGSLSAGNALGVERGERLLRTCYPSNDDSSAEPVRIDRADLEGLEIRMRRGRTFTVSGTILDVYGAPVPSARADFNQFKTNGGSSSGVEVDGTGRFRIRNVPPGNYSIQASILEPESPQARPAAASQTGLVEVQVVDADVDLVVPLKNTVDVQGRLVVEDGVTPLPPPTGGGFMIRSDLAGARLPDFSSRSIATVRTDRTFTLQGMFGGRVLRFFNVPRGWYVKAIRYGDRDVVDTPVEFVGGRDAPMLEVVLSNRGAVINGTVTGDDGTPARGAMVFLLRLAGPRGIDVADTARATAAGAFTLGPVLGGEYVVVALPSTSEVLPSAAQDRLARLAALGERVTLTDLDERSVPLRIVRER